ncbi:MAG: hypothetical protein AB1644_07795 [Candidatus Zixiibacteriota bacterium]
MGDEQGGAPKPTQPYWLVYLAALLSGLLMLAQAMHYYPATKITAKLGVALIYSAIALFIGNGRPAGFIATTIIWVAVIVSLLV